MSVSIEKIDLLKERANISYGEAREVLEKFDGNVVEALIYLESNKRTVHNHVNSEPQEQSQRRHHQHGRKASGLFKKIHETRFIISKGQSTIIDLPMSISLIFIIITMPLSLFVLIGAAITGNKITVVKPDGVKINLEDAIEFVDKQEDKTE